MLRVVHVLEALRGGTSRHVVDVVTATHGVEHHVVVPRLDRAASASGALVDRAALGAMEAAGAVRHELDMRRSMVHPANPVAAVHLARLAHQLDADVLHGHSSIGGAVARFGGQLARVPAVYTPNGLATGRIAVAVERLLGRVTSAFVAVSASEEDLARSLHLVPPARLHTIPNGIELDPPAVKTLDLRAHLGLEAATPLIGTVARLVEQKAPVNFVDAVAVALAERPDTHALLIGMGPLQDEVDAAVAHHKLGPRWHQIGHLPNAAAHLDQLQVFVLLSRFEGSPYTPLEAMRARVPVVLSDVVGNQDVVEDGVDGILVAFGDAISAGCEIGRLLDDPARRSCLAGAAFDRLRESADLSQVGARLYSLYQRLSGPHAPQRLSC